MTNAWGLKGSFSTRLRSFNRPACGETLTPQAEGCGIQGRLVNEEAKDQLALLEADAHKYSCLEEQDPTARPTWLGKEAE